MDTSNERRKEDECPICHSRMKAIINNDLCCIGIGCQYIYRRNVIKHRLDDKTIAELKEDWK